MVHHRARGAAGRGRTLSARQENDDAGKQHHLVFAALNHPAAQGDEELLIDRGIFRIEMPMAHGDAHLVGRECDGLRGGCRGRNRERKG